MSCASASPGPLRCPTKEECLEAALGLHPRGRAWDNHDGGPWPGSILHGFWSAIAEVMEFVHARWCALLPEFFCSTASETRDRWNAEYALPDPCDPYPDLCAKAGAIGGASCAYLQSVARSNGWEIECSEIEGDACGASAGCATTGCDGVGGATRAAGFTITVHLGDSPAFLGRRLNQPQAGDMSAGSGINCEPDIASLQCLLSRVLHAHLAVSWLVIPAPTYLMADPATHVLYEDTPGYLIEEN